MNTEDTGVRRNIELKARLDSLDEARRTAQRLATDHPGVQIQTDTYFHCPDGRLKLREIEGEPAQLVWYARPDQRQAAASRYLLVTVPDPAGLKQALTAALGVRGVVRKQREVFLYRSVRIHLDEVDGLGQFLEFEAVLGPAGDESSGHALIDQLVGQFGITESSLLEKSYGDMAVPGRPSQLDETTPHPPC